MVVKIAIFAAGFVAAFSALAAYACLKVAAACERR